MAIKIENKNISLSVRDLVPGTLNSPIMSSFPMPQRGAMGTKAQTWLQAGKRKRQGMFHSEYAVNRSYDYFGYTFLINGRIDGVFKLNNRVEIEEIKSVILKNTEFKNVQPELYPHFIEQLLLYAYLLQDELEGLEVMPFLVMVNLIDYKDRVFPVAYNRMQVETFLNQRFTSIIHEIEEELAEKERRKAELSLIDFNLPESRLQQIKMMKAVHSALKEQQHLMVSAPTGTGKTAAVLFPIIQKAYAEKKRILFLTSKTTQQEIVKETLSKIVEQGLDLRVGFLKASKKMCANDIFFCHEDHCGFAKEYRSRLEETGLIKEILEQKLISPDYVYERAVQNELCPFELNVDVNLNCDVVVGDYNYLFDPAVKLNKLFLKTDPSDWIVIIDEAHNLYERGRGYLSPHIGRQKVKLLRDSLKRKKDKVFGALKRALTEVDKLFANLQLEGEVHFGNQQYFEADLNVVAWQDTFSFFESAYISYLIHKIKKGIVIIDDPFELFYFTLRRFVQVARFREAAFVTYYDAIEGGILNIQCCDPSMYLLDNIDRFHSVIAMSATLDPINYYREVLGFPDYRTKTLQLDSPFAKENRKLIIVPNISTRFKDRMESYPKIGVLIKETIKTKPGNYLVFFPSYDYMQKVNIFVGNNVGEKIMQRPGMKDEDREAVLNKLRQKGKAHLLMGVMGGIFSEGVDYNGEMAIGVIVIGPALPKFGYERQLLHRYYEEKNGTGKEYAYLYPGMNKVIQSVGRLIRSYTDRGIILLVGERFAEEEFNILLPDYWLDKKDDLVITKNYKKEIKLFWKKVN